MKQYKLQMFTMLSGIPWQHDFEMASDTIALEWAMRAVQSAGLPHSCMSVILWRMTDEHKIGEFKLANSVQRID